MNNPDIKWYTAISESRNLPDRCSFATNYRCPRFFDSLKTIGSAGASSLTPEDSANAVEHWSVRGLWPIATFERVSISVSRGQVAAFSNFCPEVMFRRFDIFATELALFESEVDKDVSIIDLNAEGAAPGDPRREWKSLRPIHYSNCTFYPRLTEFFDETPERSVLEDAVIVSEEESVFDAIKVAIGDFVSKR